MPLISLRSKFYFSLFLDMKIWASCACILNSKSAASRPIWLKFGQIVVRWVTYKTVSANFNSSFHFKGIAYFSLAVAISSHPRIYLLVIKNRRTFQKSETRFFRQTCQEMKAVLIVVVRLFLVSVELNE